VGFSKQALVGIPHFDRSIPKERRREHDSEPVALFRESASYSSATLGKQRNEI